jgi:hypothetical protein
MAAIDLARLKIRTAQLVEQFSDPPLFLRRLHELLDLYTNHTLRSAQTVRRTSLLSYQTPAPVLRQIENAMLPLAGQYPDQAIALVTALWKDSALESRVLAGHLTGSIPPTEAIPLLSRLPEWLSQTTEMEIHQALLGDALARLRKENPQTFFLLVEDWLESPRSAWQIWGMQALIPLLREPGFENLPVVFRILRPAILQAGPITQVDLQKCLAELEVVSLPETTLFLRQLLSDHPSPTFVRTIQRILPALSPSLQISLKECLRERGT